MLTDTQNRLLRPTVKRDLSLFSVQAWQKGYTKYLNESLGWWYNIYFYYDGKKVNFYHKKDDFEYFKTVITEKIIKEDSLFKHLNTSFKRNVRQLSKISREEISITLLPKISELIGKIMSFYIFVVSDDFVSRRPEAWESRHMSEGILYMIDEQIEKYMKEKLKASKYDQQLSHVISTSEFRQIVKFSQSANVEQFHNRLNSYLLFNKELILNSTFEEYCKLHFLINPEDEVEKVNEITLLEGSVACKGNLVKGTGKVIMTKDDLKKIQKGDILISIMTNVNYIIAMKKVSAIITDEGGITCHAAIIAREFQVPCIVGTKIATKVFRDGDILEVDTQHGTIKKVQ